jgi:hypothetical protein
MYLGGELVASEESILEEVFQALLPDSRLPGPVTPDYFMDKEAHMQMLDPSSSLSSAMGLYLEAFFLNFNHILYLFNEPDLQETFRNVLERQVNKHDALAELYLCLALGAGQRRARGESIRNKMYRKSLMHFTLLRKWNDATRLMRFLTLLCLYHFDLSVDSSQQFICIRPFSSNSLFKLSDISSRSCDTYGSSYWPGHRTSSSATSH